MIGLSRSRTRDVPAKTDPMLPGPPRGSVKIDVAGLKRALRSAVDGEVRFDPGALAMYANDASNFRQVPIGVVVPRTVDAVVAAHQVCHQFGAPILNRGGGTSLSGETVNYAVVIDHSKYLTGIGDIDPERRLVTCEPGVINEELNRQTGKYNLVFGPDPSSHSRCVIGGNIGNNSCGIHSVQSQLYGPGPRTSDNTHALEIVTYDGARFWVGNDEESRLDEIIAAGGRKGEIYAALRDLRDKYAPLIRERFRPVTEVPRRVSGYNLDELLPERGCNVARALVGTESTCVTVLRSTLMLTPALLQRTLVVVGYSALADAAEHCSEIIEQWRPIGLEGLDEELIQEQAAQHMHIQDIEELPQDGSRAWLLVQFGADTAEESLSRAADFAKWLTAKKGYAEDRILVMPSKQEGGQSQDIWEIREGGLGSTAFARGEDNWPGWEDSAVPPSQIGRYVVDLRNLMNRHGLKGAMYGHFGQGCIHCRLSFDLRHADGIANYRAFLEEAADLVVSYGGSLSGEHGDGQQRAELLEKQYGPELLEAMREFKRIWDPQWKMNPGKVIDPYRLDENLRLGVDYNPPRPATKFKFPEEKGDFAHATLRCVGIGKCRVPEGAPTMCPSYQVTREEKHSTRGRSRLLFEMLRPIAKRVAGVDPKRPLPRFAPMTLQEWFRQRGGTTNPTWRPVVLFPDTFNNHLHVDVGVACVEAIEAAGWRVIMPSGHVCCGRPLYDYGFLDTAQRYLHRMLDVLRPYVRDGVPIVGMEPSCVAVFKDELRKMLPHDDDADRLASNVYHFPEFFTRFGIDPPAHPGRLDGRKALLWGHCHHRATGGMEPEKELLQQMGLAVWNVQGGCCGLAGSWGFESGKYDISMDCGEEALLPAIREADPDVLVVADGFSCKTQIADSDVGRHALHTAEVMKLARAEGATGMPAPPTTRRVARVAAAVAPALAVLGAAGIAIARRRALPRLVP